MSFKNPVWSRRIVRTIGIASILFAVYGGFLAVTGAPRILPGLRDSPALPYVREAYFVIAFVDLCCLITLTVGGVYLLRLRRAGLIISNVGFATEIGWLLAQASVPLAVSSAGGGYHLGMSIMAAGGIGGLATAPQEITGYPILALIFLNLARGGLPNSAQQA